MSRNLLSWFSDRRLLLVLVACASLILGLAGAPRAAQAQVMCTNTHVVQPGENLFRIALAAGTSWPVLAQLNGIADPNLIYVGETLCLPGGTIITPPPVVVTPPPIVITPPPVIVPPPGTGVVLPPPGIFPSIALSTYIAAPGQTITITGINFPTNSDADVLVTPLFSMLPYTPVAATTTSATGTVNFAFTIPTTVNGAPLAGPAISVMVRTRTTGYFGFNFFYNNGR